MKVLIKMNISIMCTGLRDPITRKMKSYSLKSLGCHSWSTCRPGFLPVLPRYKYWQILFRQKYLWNAKYNYLFAELRLGVRYVDKYLEAAKHRRMFTGNARQVILQNPWHQVKAKLPTYRINWTFKCFISKCHMILVPKNLNHFILRQNRQSYSRK